MHQCWLLSPEIRPTFSQLVESLSNSLEGMAGYIHIGAFGIRADSSETDIPLVDGYMLATKEISLTPSETNDSTF